MKRKLVAALFAATVVTMLTACGTPPTLEPVSEAASTEDEVAEEVPQKEEEPTQADSKQEAEETEEKKEQTQEQEANMSLSDYALHLDMASLYRLDVEYEKVTEDGASYYKSKGLSDGGKNGKGVLDWELVDLDQDSNQELLTMNLDGEGSKWEISLSVYEEKDGVVKKADSKTILSDFFPQGADQGDVRFFLQNDRYICVDSSQAYFLSADGITYTIKAFSYDGEALQEMADYSISGSDFYEAGKDATDLVDQLNTMGLEKSASGVYDRDSFRLCAADEGLLPLSKLMLSNSYAGNNPDQSMDPYVNIDYVEGLDDADSYIFADSNVRALTKGDLEGLTKDELRIARNEIYARYGWSFKDEELGRFFEQKAWYVPYENISDEVLSEIELTNQNLIAEAEKNAPSERKALQPEGSSPLSKEELSSFQTMFNDASYNGLLCCNYKTPKDANPDEIFYNGAGISYDEAYEQAIETYLKKTDQDEVYTDLTMLKESDVEAYLMEHLGVSLAEMHHHFDYVYLPEEKLYALEHGDTNYRPFEVTDGFVSADGSHYILYAIDSFSLDQEKKVIVKVTLEKNGENYRFLSVE